MLQCFQYLRISVFSFTTDFGQSKIVLRLNIDLYLPKKASEKTNMIKKKKTAFDWKTPEWFDVCTDIGSSQENRTPSDTNSVKLPTSEIIERWGFRKEMTGGSDTVSLPDLAAVREVQLTSKQPLVHQTET